MTPRVGSFLLAAGLVLLHPPDAHGQPADAAVPPRTDALGAPLPSSARFRLGPLRLRHGNPVTALAFAPDGRTLAVGEDGRAVTLWEAATGRPVWRLAVPLRFPHTLAFSADGRLPAAV